MKLSLHTLARENEFLTTIEYYEYIVNSLINGNRTQVKDLFNAMKKHDQNDFLINFLDVSIGWQKSVLNICIGELTS